MITYEKYLYKDLSIFNYEDGLREFGETDNCLNKCLEKLFPNNTFIHNKFIKYNEKYIVNSFGQKIRPDYVCEDLKIIIEYDGYQHYTNPNIALKDIENTKILKQHGYNVIRIPFYVQLSADNIYHYFDVSYDERLYTTCKDDGFLHPHITLPAEFCELGLIRFYKELWNLPKITILNIILSIGYRIYYVNNVYDSKYFETVIPRSFCDTFKYLIAYFNFPFDFSKSLYDKCIDAMLNLPIIDDILHEDINSMITPEGTILYLSNECDIHKIINKYNKKASQR